MYRKFVEENSIVFEHYTELCLKLEQMGLRPNVLQTMEHYLHFTNYEWVELMLKSSEKGDLNYVVVYDSGWRVLFRDAEGKYHEVDTDGSILGLYD